jgi:ABC-type hemin transport system substrate-binding protein
MSSCTRSRGVLAVDPSFSAEGKIAGVPAVAEKHADDVVPGLDAVGDVVGAGVHAFFVVRPSGRQALVFGDTLAVEVKLVDA